MLLPFIKHFSTKYRVLCPRLIFYFVHSFGFLGTHFLANNYHDNFVFMIRIIENEKNSNFCHMSHYVIHPRIHAACQKKLFFSKICYYSNYDLCIFSFLIAIFCYTLNKKGGNITSDFQLTVSGFFSGIGDALFG